MPRTASSEAIAMDMSAAYVKATKETIPLAEEKIVHDRFHVMMNSKIMSIKRRVGGFPNIDNFKTAIFFH